ncbi:MAG: hypothetical protein IMF11_20270 [Proteobacteria bacterium]|nr:hypothetical protein [Pseudomonadota bacterium]
MDYEKETVPEKTIDRFEEEIRQYGLHVSGRIESQNDVSVPWCCIREDVKSRDSVSVSGWKDLRWLHDKLAELLEKEPHAQ